MDEELVIPDSWPGYDDWLTSLDNQALKTIEESAGSSSPEPLYYIP